jgi:hypothetical protein
LLAIRRHLLRLRQHQHQHLVLLHPQPMVP